MWKQSGRFSGLANAWAKVWNHGRSCMLRTSNSSRPICFEWLARAAISSLESFESHWKNGIWLNSLGGIPFPDLPTYCQFFVENGGCIDHNVVVQKATFEWLLFPKWLGM
jgi:hypothetical protein